MMRDAVYMGTTLYYITIIRLPLSKSVSCLSSSNKNASREVVFFFHFIGFLLKKIMFKKS